MMLSEPVTESGATKTMKSKQIKPNKPKAKQKCGNPRKY